MDVLCTQPACDGSVGSPSRGQSTCFLVVESSEGNKEINLQPGVCVIGRGVNCGITLSDLSLSRKHALLEVDSDGICTIMDQGSLNGSLRNSVRIKPFVKYEVRCDDRLQFGCVRCVFKIRNINESEFTEELTQLPDENFENKNSEVCRTCKDNASTTDGIVSPRVLCNQSSEIKLAAGSNSSTADDTDRDSVSSAHLLADILVDSMDPMVSDLAPNPSQFFSRSPSPQLESARRGTDSGKSSTINVPVRKSDADESFLRSPPAADETRLITIDNLAKSEPLDLPNPTSFSNSTQRTTIGDLPFFANEQQIARPSFALVFSATPSHEAEKSRELPISRIPLARDSDPGGMCSVVDPSCSHSSWNELPETQPALTSSTNLSVLCVEESNVFSNGVTHMGHFTEQEDFALVGNSANLDIRSNLTELNKSIDVEEVQAEACSCSSPQPHAVEYSDSNSVKSSICAGQSMSTSDRRAADSDLDCRGRFSELAQPIRQSDACSDIAITQVKDDTQDGCRSSPTTSVIPTNLDPGDSSMPVGSKLLPSLVEITGSKSYTKPKNQTVQLDHVSPVQSTLADDVSEGTQPMRQSATTEVTTDTVTQIGGNVPSQSTRLTSQASFVYPSVILSTPEIDTKQMAAKRASCMTTAGLTRQRTSCLVLSKELGTLTFRSRCGRGRLRKKRVCASKADVSATGTDVANSSLSPVGIVKDLQIAEPSWFPVRRASTCFHSTALPYAAPLTLPLGKPMIRRPKSSFHSKIPSLPSPVRLSGSLLSEDPSQLNDSVDVVMKVMAKKLDKPTSRSSDGVVFDSIDHRAVNSSPTATRSPSAFVLAGFDDSADEIDMKVPSIPAAGACLSPFIDLRLDRGAPNSHGTRLIGEPPTEAVSPVKPCRSSRRTTQSRLNLSNKRPLFELPAKHAHPADLEEKPPVRRSTRRTRTQKVDIRLEEVNYKTIEEQTEAEGNTSSDQSSLHSPRRIKIRRQTRASAVVKREKYGKNAKKSAAVNGNKTNRRGQAICSDDTSFESDSGRPSRSARCSSHLTTPCFVVLDGSLNNPVKALFSGVSATSFRSLLSHLSIAETEDVLTASLLISSPDLKRTRKVLYARARGIPLVSVDWLFACRRVRKPPYPKLQNFILQVPGALTSETGSSCRKRPSIRKNVIGNDSSVFLSGWTLTCTPSVLPGPEDLAQLTNLCGGCWISADRDLIKASTVQPPRTVIICEPKDFTNVSASVRQRRKSELGVQLPSQSALSRSIKHLPCISVEWFLQAVMHRQPPKWPIDKEFRLHPL